MGTARARWCWFASVVMVVGGVAAPAARAAQTSAEAPPGTGHLRSSDHFLASVMRGAPIRSATFRALVLRIDASDGIVYVEPGRCRTGPRSCLVHVSPGGTHRFFRIHVATNRPEWDLIGAIAHELWHVTEMLGVPTVRNNAAMYLFYDRQGLHRSSGFETREAIRAGDLVRREVRRAGGRLESVTLASVQ